MHAECRISRSRAAKEVVLVAAAAEDGLEALEGKAGAAVAEIEQRGAFDRFTLAAVLGERDGAEAVDEEERAAGVDLGELAEIADEHDLGPGKRLRRDPGFLGVCRGPPASSPRSWPSATTHRPRDATRLPSWPCGCRARRSLPPVGHWSPNELRHSAGSLLSAAGVPLEQIAEVLGHTDTRMLERVYRHPVKKTVSAAAEPMERMFGDDQTDDGEGGPTDNGHCRTLAAVTVPGLAVDEAKLREVCTRYGVARLEVFGSVSRGDAGPDSDVDVLYDLAPGARLGWDIEKLADELTTVLGRHVDLVSRNALHRRLRDGVLAEARLLYAA